MARKSGRNTGKRRDEILSLIERREGLTRSQICHLLGISWGASGHHLKSLEREGAIAIHRRGRSTHATLPHRTDAELDVLLATESVLAKNILRALRTRPLRSAELARIMNRSPKTVRTALQKLESVGIVQGNGEYHPEFDLAPNRMTVLGAERQGDSRL